MSQMFAWIWRWLVPERQSIYDRQLLVLAFSLMSVGLIMVASASITEGVSLQNDAFFFAAMEYFGTQLASWPGEPRTPDRSLSR